MKRLIYTILITAGLALAISRGWNELWGIWYEHKNWDWLWTVLNWSIGRVAYDSAIPKWSHVNEGTMIFVGMAIYGAQWVIAKLRRKEG